MLIELVGPYPPPFGGVAVHVQRLRSQLEARGHAVRVSARWSEPNGDPRVRAVHVRPRWILGRALRGPAADVVHVHTFETDAAALHGFALLARLGWPVLLTVHTFRDEPPTRTWRYRCLTPRALRAYRVLIAAGPEVRAALVSAGAPPADVRVISPYLPPPPKGAHSMPGKVEGFLQRHAPIIVANAPSLRMYDGADLYGLDLCIELVDALRRDHPELGLLFLLGRGGDEAYLERMRGVIETRGLQEHLLIWVDTLEFWPLIARADLMVRPTRQDSYGISVREALELGVPAVATEVCARPAGTVLVPPDDPAAFIAASRAALAGGRRRPPAPAKAGNEMEQILDAYRAVMR